MFDVVYKKYDFPPEGLPSLKNAYMSIKENPDANALFETAQETLLHPNQVVFDDVTAKILEETNLQHYTLNAVICIFCLDALGDIYKEQNNQEQFDKRVEALKPQLLRCKEKHDLWGLEECFWQWMFHGWQCAHIGRLTFEPFHHFRDITYKGIRKGDPVILIHIPGGKPLNTDEVMESLRLAYDRFKDRFENETVPFMTHSWLIYPPYLNGVFKESGNMYKFAKLFDVIDQNAENYLNFQNIFGCSYPGEKELCNLPQETSLQRNILQFIKEGKVMGQGYGFLLYGKNGIIKDNEKH